MKTIILFILIFIAFNSCQKEYTTSIKNIDQDLKDWMFFDTGTWWLYENIKTGDLDSQYVTKSEIFYFEYDDTKHRIHKKTQSAKVFINNDNFYLFTTNSIEKLKPNWANTYLVFKPANRPLTVGERRSSCSSLGYTEMTDIDNNFTLNNIYYNTKITVLESKDCTEGNDSVEYQVFKGVGIINKKNITKNQEWKLIKYHIKLNKN